MMMIKRELSSALFLSCIASAYGMGTKIIEERAREGGGRII